VSTGAKEESSTGRVWTAGFHHVKARSRLARVLKLVNRLFINFQFFSGRGKPRILNHCIRGHACTSFRNTALLPSSDKRTPNWAAPQKELFSSMGIISQYICEDTHLRSDFYLEVVREKWLLKL
jgi:hypothetical protein